MPNFSAKLNQRFRDLLGKHTVHYEYGTFRWKEKDRNRQWSCPYVQYRLSCCGIYELNLQQFLQQYECFSPTLRETALAKYISQDDDGFIDDHRILIMGIPRTVGIHSMYDLDKYKWVEKTLLSWGFKPVVNKPYRNKNSGNTITVLVGQL